MKKKLAFVVFFVATLLMATGCSVCLQPQGFLVRRPDGSRVLESNKRVVLNKFGRDWSQYKAAIKDPSPDPSTKYFLSSSDPKSSEVKIEVLPQNLILRPNIRDRICYIFDEYETVVVIGSTKKYIKYQVLELPIAVGSNKTNINDYVFSYDEKK